MTLNIMIFSIKPDGIMTLSIIKLYITILIMLMMLSVIKTDIKAT
jgi:hypothetical protein